MTREHTKAASAALFLPGEDCLCIEEAMRHGTIDRSTFIVAVEQDPAIAEIINEKLYQLVDVHHMHVGPIQTLTLKQVLGRRKLNFAFFDFCGQLTRDIARWLSEQAGVFAQDSYVAFTFATQCRYNKLITGMQARVEDRKYTYIRKQIDKQLIRCARFIHGSTNQFRRPTIFAAFVAMAARYRVELVDCEEYCDRTPMVMLRFRVHFEREPLAGPSQYQRILTATGAGPVQTMCSKKAEAVRLLPDWAKLGCAETMTPGQKAAHVRWARAGKRPKWLSPQQWAWNAVNPKGIRKGETV